MRGHRIITLLIKWSISVTDLFPLSVRSSIIYKLRAPAWAASAGVLNLHVMEMLTLLDVNKVRLAHLGTYCVSTRTHASTLVCMYILDRRLIYEYMNNYASAAAAATVIPMKSNNFHNSLILYRICLPKDMAMRIHAAASVTGWSDGPKDDKDSNEEGGRLKPYIHIQIRIISKSMVEAHPSKSGESRCHPPRTKFYTHVN